jgi:hypothetical protein
MVVGIDGLNTPARGEVPDTDCLIVGSGKEVFA